MSVIAYRHDLSDRDNVIATSAEVMLWQAGEMMDENGEMLAQKWEDHFDESDLTDEARERIVEDFAAFVGNVSDGDLLAYEAAGETSAQMIHDYWLARNRHGAGFWDRGLGELGDRLTELAQSDGTYNLFETNDGEWDYM